ncbi:MAG: S1 RNA-binding domain-containing protein [Candidatus Woesearchaeota archaeon]|nr:S1 RNA-binding domain-containing protein [Candidatus Woesearchaeota archaeon]
MFFHKTGFPEESEIVLCTVTNIQYSSVFVTIDEFNQTGMIHISEIAAGRIRNIRDYVKEGKKVVCKVLKIYQDKGHIDLSLRRVNEKQRKNKVNEIKMEQKAEAIIEHVAKQRNQPAQKVYDEVAKSLLKEYRYLHFAFESVVTGELVLSKALEPKLAKEIEEIVLQRFKPQKVEITGVLEITTYEGNGLELIKESLLKAIDMGVLIHYLGGGKYRVTAEAPDYKEAEPKLGSSISVVEEFLKKRAVVTFTR